MNSNNNSNQSNDLNDNEKYIIDSLIYDNISQVFTILANSEQDIKKAIQIFYQLIYDTYAMKPDEFKSKYSNDFTLIEQHSTNNEYLQLSLLLDPIKKIHLLLSKDVNIINKLNLNKFREDKNIDYPTIIYNYIEIKLFNFINSIFNLKKQTGFTPKDYKEKTESLIEVFNPEFKYQNQIENNKKLLTI